MIRNVPDNLALQLSGFFNGEWLGNKQPHQWVRKQKVFRIVNFYLLKGNSSNIIQQKRN